MKLLITTPFFRNLGGSELETIHTANTFANFDFVKKIDLYVESQFDLEFTKGIFINPKIKFKTKSKFLKSRYFNYVDRIWTNKFKNHEKLSNIIYWNFFNTNKYDKIYIITKSTLDYFIPILKRYKVSENVLIKYTTFFYQPLPIKNPPYVKKVRRNLVTSKSQSDYLKDVLKIDNVESQEIIVHNESYGLSKVKNTEQRSQYDFGILGRFYPEKKLEDAIKLIATLKEKGYLKSLLIKGGGLIEYFEEIQLLVKKLNVGNQVTLQFEIVSYDRTFDFFDQIDCFLITSKYEGGPNIGLEAMAYGLPIISYNVGAMKDRLANFPELIAENYEELVIQTIQYLDSKEKKFDQYCKNMKNEYVLQYSNVKKIEFLYSFLNS